MDTISASQVVLPFGKINIWNLPDGTRQVRAYIIVERPLEGAKTGVAIDGSASLRLSYGFSSGFLGMFFPKRSKTNIVSPQVHRICEYLAKNVDVDGVTNVLYWGTGDKSGFEVIGDLNESQLATSIFGGPKRFGSKTKLTPVVKRFTDLYKSAKWGIFVFITDGAIDDLPDVKLITKNLAIDIANKKRNPVKLFLLGVGTQIIEQQMIELDDFDPGVGIDLWDHKIASDMSQLAEIFTELVDENMILAENGIVRDSKGRLVKEYRDTGLPALLEFILPADASDAFLLEFGGQVVRQPISK